MWAIPTGTSSVLKKKKSPIPESRVPETGSDPPIGSDWDSGRDRFTWGILSCLSFSSNVVSHLTTTVTFMMNSIGESHHVGHSIIRFKIYLLLCIKFTYSSIHAHMHLFDRHFEYQ